MDILSTRSAQPLQPLLTAAMVAHLTAGLRTTLARDEAQLARMKRLKKGAHTAPEAASLLRRVAAARAELVMLGEWH